MMTDFTVEQERRISIRLVTFANLLVMSMPFIVCQSHLRCLRCLSRKCCFACNLHFLSWTWTFRCYW